VQEMLDDLMANEDMELDDLTELLMRGQGSEMEMAIRSGGQNAGLERLMYFLQVGFFSRRISDNFDWSAIEGDLERIMKALEEKGLDPGQLARIRNYLEHELKLDEPTRLKWIRHWSNEALTALETHLNRDKQTGRYCHGDQVTMADICVVTHAVGAKLFEIDLKPYPTVFRIVDECLKIDAFARAHPLKQPGAPASGGH